MGVRSDAEWVIAALGRPHVDRPTVRRLTYAQVDPVLRARVRARVEALVTDATFSTLHPLDEGHLHRVALLTLRGQSVMLEGVEDVARRFEDELARRPARGPSRHVATGLVLMVPLLAIALLVLSKIAPDHWLDPTLLPVSPHAYREGGRPDPGDAAVRALFVDTIPAFVIALDRTQPGGDTRALDAAERQVHTEAHALLGHAAEVRLGEVLARSRALRGADEFSTVDDYLRAVDAFNAALEARGLGYYLDAEVASGPKGGGRLYLASFTVERVRYYESEGRSLRALRLTRRDTLNFVRGVLGFTRPQLRDALVLTERVDTWLAQRVVGGLALDGRLTLTGEDRRRVSTHLADLEARAARAAHAELAKLASGCASLADTSALFARRRAVFAALSEQARARGMYVQEPLGYEVDASPFEAVRHVLEVGTYDELRRVAWALDDDDHRACFRALREPLLTSVERHEVQHRLDLATGLPGELPEELARRIGPLSRFGLDAEAAKRALTETSAYLSEIARGPELAKLNLAMLSQFVLDRTRWSSAEYVAAVLIFDGLTSELGLPLADPSDAPPSMRVESALGPFFERDEAELSRAAGRLWQRLMGRPLPPLVVRRG